MNKLLLAGPAALALAGALLTAPAQAQVPYRPGGYLPPAYSPYLNLLRQGNPAINYYGLVRPQIDFRNQIQGLQQLTAAAPQTASTLTVARNQLYDFVLSATATALAEVRLDVLDGNGAVVFTLRSYAGAPASTGHVYLTAGTYRLVYSAAAPSGQNLPAVDFSLTGRVVSDPIGPQQDKEVDPVKGGMRKGEMSDQDVSGTTPTWDQPYYA